MLHGNLVYSWYNNSRCGLKEIGDTAEDRGILEIVVLKRKNLKKTGGTRL